MRRVPSVDNLIPILYLKGVSSGDMSEALASILRAGAAGLSATNLVRLKAQWEQDYQTWSAQSFVPPLSNTRCGYLILPLSVNLLALLNQGKHYPWPRPPRCPRCGGHDYGDMVMCLDISTLWWSRYG
jgi:hypothetical protein